jgi:polyphosphate kinase 2 (PPK2 family)
MTETRPRAADVASGGRDNPPDVAEELAHLRVDIDSDGEPVLLREDGTVVDTWRQGYPYDERLSRTEYDRTKRLLQIELLKLQDWVKETGEKVLILFEGRDAAGKGGTIKRFTEHLNPRGATVVALEKPNERESTQWYFQRYIKHLPAAGEIVLFDRSWYNRAGVERVMGFADPAEYIEVYAAGPELERMLVRPQTCSRRVSTRTSSFRRCDYRRVCVPSAVVGWSGWGEEVDEQLGDAFVFVVVDPV